MDRTSFIQCSKRWDCLGLLSNPPFPGASNLKSLIKNLAPTTSPHKTSTGWYSITDKHPINRILSHKVNIIKFEEDRTPSTSVAKKDQKTRMCNAGHGRTTDVTVDPYIGFYGKAGSVTPTFYKWRDTMSLRIVPSLYCNMRLKKANLFLVEVYIPNRVKFKLQHGSSRDHPEAYDGNKFFG